MNEYQNLLLACINGMWNNGKCVCHANYYGDACDSGGKFHSLRIGKTDLQMTPSNLTPVGMRCRVESVKMR